jgi:NhaA family Na+:H+ antiporter
MNKKPIDRFLIIPISKFINNSTASGIVLFFCALLALIIANSPLKEMYHHFWEKTFTIGFENAKISKTLHHWINDGLMSIFFFVIGLELKREIMGGELSKPKEAILPIFAALGGMLFPALIFFAFNSSGNASAGWGIPMATDIAFALGILYLLGDKIPTSLKIFLTALAIADDLGAVLVIALFYTSDISSSSLIFAGIFLVILLAANLLGVRNVLFYGIVGIGGLWIAFLMSGVHATIAGVLAALTIPADVRISEKYYLKKIRSLTKEFDDLEPNNNTLVTDEQLHVIEKIRYFSREALTPLQRLEHSMHPIVAFVVMPIFAFANAGITFTGNFGENLFSNVSLGVIAGLIAGKFLGVLIFSKILIHFKLASLPKGVNWLQMYGIALLAGVGFTMSLFISDLAFDNEQYILQSKIGIFVASLLSGLVAYFILKFASKKTI